MCYESALKEVDGTYRIVKMVQWHGVMKNDSFGIRYSFWHYVLEGLCEYVKLFIYRGKGRFCFYMILRRFRRTLFFYDLLNRFIDLGG